MTTCSRKKCVVRGGSVCCVPVCLPLRALRTLSMLQNQVMRVARRLHLTSITDRQNDVACSGSEQFHTIHMMTLPHHTPWVAPDTSNDVTLPSNDCFRALLHSVSHGATRDNFCRLSVKDQALRVLLWHRSCYPPALDAGIRCADAVSTVPQDHNAKANAMTGTATKSSKGGRPRRPRSRSSPSPPRRARRPPPPCLQPGSPRRTAAARVAAAARWPGTAR